MSIEEDFRKGLVNYYRQQSGGSFPVFRGAEYQYGNGIGDIFKSIARFVFPILRPAATKFISSAAGAMNEGKTLKEAALGALQPTMGEAISAAGSQIMNRINQKGQGRKGYKHRRATSHKLKKSKKHAKARRIKKQHRAIVYKGAARKKNSRIPKQVRFLPHNF